MKKLKEHLLPRIFGVLELKAQDLHDSNSQTASAQTSVLIKDDRIFNHKLARFYYTTYDVRRMEDIINPRTSHCDVMMLSDPGPVPPNENASDHPFLYGRVIGIYHANVVYVGPGMKMYDLMRFDFLHIRWFQLEEFHNGRTPGYNSPSLNCLSFPLMAHEDSFSFLDPKLVLRSCHLIPAFSGGKKHSDGIGFSSMSKDSKDWKYYYVNQ